MTIVAMTIVVAKQATQMKGKEGKKKENHEEGFKF